MICIPNAFQFVYNCNYNNMTFFKPAVQTPLVEEEYESRVSNDYSRIPNELKPHKNDSIGNEIESNPLQNVQNEEILEPGNVYYQHSIALTPRDTIQFSCVIFFACFFCATILVIVGMLVYYTR